MKKSIIFTIAGMVLLAAPLASAYDEAPVADGGTVTGKVMFKGTPQKPKEFELAKFPNPNFCKNAPESKEGKRYLTEVKVDDKGALKDVVVAIQGIEKGKPFELAKSGTDVKSVLCRFLSQSSPSSGFVGVVVKNGEVRVENTDADPDDPKAKEGVLHNPHSYEVSGALGAQQTTTVFNKPLPTKGSKITEKVKLRKKGSAFKIECDQHGFMQTWFYQADSPYYAVVGEDGSFSIDQVPPGEYQMVAWHPILGIQEQKIKVDAKGKASANFEFKSQ